MPFERGSDLVAKALEKVQEERAWEMYISVFPNMTEKTYLTFEQFQAKSIQGSSASQEAPSSNEPSVDELIAQAERIKQIDQEQRGLK